MLYFLLVFHNSIRVLMLSNCVGKSLYMFLESSFLDLNFLRHSPIFIEHRGSLNYLVNSTPIVFMFIETD